MNNAAKLALFAAAVGVIFGSAMVVGAAVGPIDVGSNGSGHGAHGASATPAADVPRGLAVAAAGYRFAPESGPLGAGTVAAGTATTLAFRILDDDGIAVIAFDQLHERALHLIVLARNLVEYLHLHPTMDARGRWTVELPALAPGSYRVFADFQPTGAANLTLGVDLLVPGSVGAVALPDPMSVTTVDGYTITMDGDPAVGEEALTFTVQRNGTTVRTDPYLGAAGHLVAIRTGDLAYLHVHPEADSSEAAVTFMSEFPTPGTYRLFFDFSHDGTVRTAAFTVEVPDGSTEGTTTTHTGGH